MNLHDEINAFYDSTALCNLRFMNKRFVTKMPNPADHRKICCLLTRKRCACIGYIVCRTI